jgi:hypothetical protein
MKFEKKKGVKLFKGWDIANIERVDSPNSDFKHVN